MKDERKQIRTALLAIQLMFIMTEEWVDLQDIMICISA